MCRSRIVNSRITNPRIKSVDYIQFVLHIFRINRIRSKNKFHEILSTPSAIMCANMNQILLVFYVDFLLFLECASRYCIKVSTVIVALSLLLSPPPLSGMAKHGGGCPRELFRQTNGFHELSVAIRAIAVAVAIKTTTAMP